MIDCFWLAPPPQQRLVDCLGGPPSKSWIAQMEEHWYVKSSSLGFESQSSLYLFFVNFSFFFIMLAAIVGWVLLIINTKLKIDVVYTICDQVWLNEGCTPKVKFGKTALKVKVSFVWYIRIDLRSLQILRSRHHIEIDLIPLERSENALHSSWKNLKFWKLDGRSHFCNTMSQHVIGLVDEIPSLGAPKQNGVWNHFAIPGHTSPE